MAEQKTTKTFVEKVSEMSETLEKLDMVVGKVYQTFKKELDTLNGKVSLLEDSINAIMDLCDKKGLIKTTEIEDSLISTHVNRRKAEVKMMENIGKIVKTETISGSSGEQDELITYSIEGQSEFNYNFFNEFNEIVRNELIGKKTGDKITTKNNQDKEIVLNILETYKLTKGSTNETKES